MFLGLFIIGYAAGSIMECLDNGVISAISGRIGNFLYLSLPTFEFINIFLTVFKVLGALLFLFFCMGMFVPGQMLLTLLSLFEGMVLGSGVAYMFFNFGWHSVALFGVIILPAILIFLNFQFIMIKRAFVLSFSIFRSVFYGSDSGIYKKYKQFMIYLGIMVAVSVLCSLLISIGYRALGKVFL